MDRVTRIAAASIGVGLLVLGLKGGAWWVTGSAALYSDALETVVNVAASVVAFLALRWAAKPADLDHPFGHAKAEFFSAVIEGALIVLASVSILFEAWATWQHPRVLSAPLLGVSLNLVATVVNAAWAWVLFRAAKAGRSPALRGDARHLLGDVVTSCGVAVGVALVLATGVLRLDPLVAAATAIYVLWSGLHLIKDSVDGLMDKAPTDGTVRRICEVVEAAHGAGVIEVHEVRTRQAGRVIFVQFHMVVPGNMLVSEAHEICDRIEAALKAEMDHLVVNIHVEPEHKAKHQDALAL